MQNKRALFGRKINNIEHLYELTSLSKRNWYRSIPYTVIRDVVLSNVEFETFSKDFLEASPGLRSLMVE